MPAAGHDTQLTPIESAPRLLRIGEVAERTGASERALRYYEEIGLLAPAGHSPGGSRRYGEAEVARVMRIRELQSLLGMNLDEIRTVLAAEDRLDALRAAWHEHEDPESRRRILEKSTAISSTLRGEVAKKLERIEAFLAQLDERLARSDQLLEELDAASERPDRPGG
jgi:DNA-binding transcriptional MerR regulator